VYIEELKEDEEGIARSSVAASEVCYALLAPRAEHRPPQEA